MSSMNEMIELLNCAVAIAKSQNYEYISPEVLLLAMCQQEDFVDAFPACGGDTEQLAEAILSAKKDGKLEIADKVSVQLLDSNTDKPIKDRIKKDSVKDNLFTALDLGLTWLERALKE